VPRTPWSQTACAAPMSGAWYCDLRNGEYVAGASDAGRGRGKTKTGALPCGAPYSELANVSRGLDRSLSLALKHPVKISLRRDAD
jgi:hypothetical protein